MLKRLCVLLLGLVGAEAPALAQRSFKMSVPGSPSYWSGGERGRYRWNSRWSIPIAGQGAVLFRAAARNDIHIAFSQGGSTSAMYEIVIGGWGNAQSVIRRGGQGQVLASARVGVQAPGQPSDYWAAIDARSGTIRAGAGNVLGERVLVEATDPRFFSTLQWISFSSWDTSITYGQIRFVPFAGAVGASQHDSIAERGRYNWSRSWQLPESGHGAILFKANARNDIHVGLSGAALSRDPMYEVVLGGWGNAQSVVRRRSQGATVAAARRGLPRPGVATDFWVAVNRETRTVSAGVGANVGQDVIVSFTDVAFLGDVRHVALSSWDTAIRYDGIRTVPAAPRVASVNVQPTAMQGELVRIVATLDRAASKVVIDHPWTKELKPAGGLTWVADIMAPTSPGDQSYNITPSAGDQRGASTRITLNVLQDFGPLSDPAYWKFPNLLFGRNAPEPPNFDRWDPAPARGHSSRYYRAFGEGAEGGLATAPSKCCTFAVKFEGHDVPIRNARIEIFKRAGPLATKWGGDGKRYTDDSGFIDLTPLFKEWAPGYSVNLFTEYPVFRLVNGGKKLLGNHVYKQTIDDLSAKDRLRFVKDERDAKDTGQINEKEGFAYGNRLMAAHEVMKRMLGDEWTSAMSPEKIVANWKFFVGLTSTGFPFPWGAETIINPDSFTPALYPPRYSTSDKTIREELAHAVHFQAVGRSAELLGRYAMFIAESATRQKIIEALKELQKHVKFEFDANSEAIRFFDTAPGREKLPSAAATRVVNRAAYSQTRKWTDLGFALGGGHWYHKLSSEVTAYVEAFGFLAANGVFEDATQGSLLEGVRAKLIEEECKSENGCNATDIAPEVGRLDTLMSADKVIKSEGHLAVLMFLDFPRLAGISVGQVFGIMKRSKAISFREFARYVQSNESRYFGALAQAAARQNIVLDQLVVWMGSN